MNRFVLVLALALLTTCATAPSDEDWARRGAETLGPFKMNLQAALKEGMAKGAENAISVCAVRAPALAGEAGSEHVRVGRAAARYRNPENAPAAWLAPIVEEWTSNPASASPRVVHRQDGLVGYVEPIFVQTMCVTCHGQTIPAEVRSKIEELYPDDKATGFKSGDFRGVFWVEFGQR